MTKNYFRCILISALCLVMGLSSCKKFPSQSVPAYIHINSMSVECDYQIYGAKTSNITDAWVYVDDQIIGCYELPATFPILEKGPHKVAIYGGIQEGGRGSARGPYPFYMPKVYRDLDLVEDSIINLYPVLNYYPIGEGVQVSWKEDFEMANSLLPMPQSDTTIESVSVIEDSHAWTDSLNSYRSGRVSLPPDSLDFYVASADELSFHKDYVSYCLLEMDYNCNDTFFVGLTYLEDYTIYSHPLVKVVPTDKQHDRPSVWKKMYVNLGPFMNDHVNADYFKVYFTSYLQTGYETYSYHPISENRYYYLDNLKVLYRPR